MQSWTTTSNTTRTIDDGRPRGNVTVSILSGRVNVVAGPPGSTAIDVEVTDVRGQAVSITDDGGTLRVEQYKAAGGDIVQSVKAWFTTRTPITSNITLTVPPATPVLVRALSAPVVISGLTGTVGVNTATGPVTLESLSGTADVKSGSGDVSASGITGHLKAKTVAGRLTLIDSAPKSVRGNSVTGATMLDLRSGALVTMNSVSGDITLRAPSGQGYDITAQSASGHVVADGATLTGGDDGSRGGHRHEGDRSLAVKARSVSGNIVLVRGDSAGPVIGVVEGTDDGPDVQDVLAGGASATTGEAPADGRTDSRTDVPADVQGEVPADMPTDVSADIPANTGEGVQDSPRTGTHRPGQVPGGFQAGDATSDNPGPADSAPADTGNPAGSTGTTEKAGE